MAFVAQDSLMGLVDLYLPDNSGPGPYSLTGASAGKFGRFAYPSGGVDGVDPVLGGGFFMFAQVAPLAAQSVSSLTISGNTATLTTGSAHGLSVGAVIQLAGFVPAGYNGLFTVATVPSTTTLTFNANSITDPAWNPSNLNVSNKANAALPTGNATTLGTYVPGIGAGQVVQFTHAKDSFGQLILQAQAWTGAANSGLTLGWSLGNPLATTASSSPANPFGGQFAWFQVGGAAVSYAAGAPAVGAQTYWNGGGGSSLGGFLTTVALASKQMQGAQFCSALAASFGSGASGTWTLPANMALVWGTYPLAQGAIT